MFQDEKANEDRFGLEIGEGIKARLEALKDIIQRIGEEQNRKKRSLGAGS